MSAPQTFSGNSNWKDYILSSAAPTWLIISHTYGNTKMICGRAPNPPQPLTSRNTWPTSPANSTSVHHTRLFLSYEPMQIEGEIGDSKIQKKALLDTFKALDATLPLGNVTYAPQEVDETKKTEFVTKLMYGRDGLVGEALTLICYPNGPS